MERAPRPKKVARAASFLWVFTFSFLDCPGLRRSRAKTPSLRPRPQDAIAATRVPAQPSKKQLEDAAEAARVAALAAAALERRNAPPVSKLEALALRVEERRSTSESADVDEAEERPDRLRSRLRLKARSASEPEQPFSDVSKLAKGPDGTTGFLRARTIKPFGFSAEVAEFVPSFSLPG